MDEFSAPTLRPASPLHLGLIVDSAVASQYIYDFVRWALSTKNINLSHLILYSRPQVKFKSRPPGFLRRSILSINANGLHFLISEWAMQTVERLERHIIKRDKHHSRHSGKFDLSSIVHDTISIRPIIPDSGYDYRFDPSDIQLIKELNFDLLLNCGTCNLRGEILNASRLWIISVCHGDDQTNYSDPTGFWEVYYQQETTGFSVQRLRDEVGAGEVLMRGCFATRHYYLLNQAFAFRKGYHYLREIVEKIAL